MPDSKLLYIFGRPLFGVIFVSIPSSIFFYFTKGRGTLAPGNPIPMSPGGPGTPLVPLSPCK